MQKNHEVIKQLKQIKEEIQNKWEHGPRGVGVSVAVTGDAVIKIVDILTLLLDDQDSHSENSTKDMRKLDYQVSHSENSDKERAKNMWKLVQNKHKQEGFNWIEFFKNKQTI